MSSNTTQSIACKECEAAAAKEPVADNNMTIACTHGREHAVLFDEPFEIVPKKADNYKEVITIKWKGGDQPEEITSDNLGNAATNPFQYKQDCAFISPYGPEKIPLWDLFRNIITYFNFQRTSFTVPSKPSFEVITYDPSEWSIEIQFPIPGDHARKQKGGYKWEKLDNGINSKTSTQSLTTNQISYDTKDRTLNRGTVTLNKQATNYFIQDKPFYTGLKFEIKRDGAAVDSDLLSLLNTALFLLDNLEKFKSIINDIPKIGWYYDWEWEVMQGSFSGTWAWKEHDNHKAYYNISLNAELKLFKLSGELGLGVSGFSIKIQAFVGAEGTVSAKLTAQNNKPRGEGNVLDIQLEPEGKITLKAGARFEALYMVKMETVAEGSIVATGNVDIDPGKPKDKISISCKIKCTGIKVNIQASVEKGGAYGTRNKSDDASLIQTEATKEKLVSTKDKNTHTKSIELLPEFTFYESQWPAKEAPVNKYECTEKEISTLLNDVLEDKYFGGWRRRRPIMIARMATGTELESRKSWLLGNTSGDYFTMIETKSISEEIAKIIAENKQVGKSQKSVEAMALAIRKEFEIISQDNARAESLDYAYVMDYNYQAFLRNQLPAILLDNLDPSKLLLLTYQSNIA